MNVVELREELSTVFEKLKTGEIAIKEAAELNNTAGKIIATAKLELEYWKLCQEKPDIAFIKMIKTGILEE